MKTADYLDEMIAAEREELALWKYKIDVMEDCFEVWRGKCLIDKKLGHVSFSAMNDKYDAVRKRFAMEAAYKAAQNHLLGKTQEETKRPSILDINRMFR